MSIYLAAQDTLVCRGVAASIAEDDHLRLVGQTRDGRVALHEISALRPRVVVLDDQLASVSGLEIVTRLGSTAATKYVLVSARGLNSSRVYLAFATGVTGYVPATSTPSELLSVLRAAADGVPRLTPEIQARLVREIQDYSAGPPTLLTPREKDVLRLLAAGRQGREVAAELHLGLSTVKKYQGQIYQKLDVTNGAAAIAAAFRQGLID